MRQNVADSRKTPGLTMDAGVGYIYMKLNTQIQCEIYQYVAYWLENCKWLAGCGVRTSGLR
jgi:hypothetical protein